MTRSSGQADAGIDVRYPTWQKQTKEWVRKLKTRKIVPGLVVYLY
jgi:hypothetical protein